MKRQKELEQLNAALREGQEHLEVLYNATERFVPKPFLKLLKKDHIEEVKLGDSVEIQLSVLFSDIRGFTTISEGLTPKQAFAFVNEYLEVTAPIIRKHHGFINQYHGDGIMALFPRKPDDSVLAVQEMSLALHEYNIGREARLKVGYGLNTGPAMLGIIGEKERMEANVISDTINLASRTESLNKFYGTEFLITQGTFRELSKEKRFVTRLIDKVRVKGKVEAVYLYEVYFQREIGEEERNFIASYELAFKIYEKGEFRDALAAFKECLILKPNNQSVILFIARCESLLKEPPSQEWDGIFEMQHK
jgi:class 3 adenylate cyclase